MPGARRLPPPHGNMRQSSVVWSSDSRSVIYSEAQSIVAWLTGSNAIIVRQEVTTGAARSLLWLSNHSRTLDVLGPGRLLLDTRSSRENLRESAARRPRERQVAHARQLARPLPSGGAERRLA